MNKKIIFFGLAIITGILIVTLVISKSISNSGDTDCTDCDNREKMSNIISKYGSAIPMEKVLDDYMKSSIYPPDSRPLTSKNVDLLNPNQRYENPQLLSKESKIYYLFTADKHKVQGRESITFSLTVTSGSSIKSKHYPVTITSSTLSRGRSFNKQEHVENVRFTSTGSDMEYLCRITPSKTEAADHHGRFFVNVTFNVKGETKKAKASFEYFPSNTIPAEFTGRFTEEIKEGSLYIYAELQVNEEGFYVIDANLFDSKSEPVAYTRYKKNLTKGRVNIPLHYFGKIFVDQNTGGPYKLKDLRGYLLLRGQDPDRKIIPSYTSVYTTRRYSAKQFSGDEYDSERKRKRIEILKKLLKQRNS